jgi:2-keto-4-pentenoate hydratase/2-oxohepta-3-ene-1,7-dioic acid hydratase in catechol pathway
VIGLLDPIELPTDASSEIHHEAELAVVVGSRLSRATTDQAASAILGYTCANDVTARDLQRRDGQWTRAKGFDTFLPLGPAIATDLDTDDLEITCRVDGDLRQHASTADLVFDVPTLLAYISRVMTLLPTDVVLTGTPAGVGPLRPGETVEVAVAGIGALVNPVVDRNAAAGNGRRH